MNEKGLELIREALNRVLIGFLAMLLGLDYAITWILEVIVYCLRRAKKVLE